MFILATCCFCDIFTLCRYWQVIGRGYVPLPAVTWNLIIQNSDPEVLRVATATIWFNPSILGRGQKLYVVGVSNSYLASYEGIIVRYFALMGVIKLVGQLSTPSSGDLGLKSLITLCMIRLLCRIPAAVNWIGLNLIDLMVFKWSYYGYPEITSGKKSNSAYRELKKRQHWLIMYMLQEFTHVTHFFTIYAYI